mmetsp:Transcript_76681/g.206742  ORF Transcript_76681/g.206742 Transcript_76681/m.206742 type:complete len:257 (-) Transcript_76681:735-1505(-)
MVEGHPEHLYQANVEALGLLIFNTVTDVLVEECGVAVDRAVGYQPRGAHTTHRLLFVRASVQRPHVGLEDEANGRQVHAHGHRPREAHVQQLLGLPQQAQEVRWVDATARLQIVQSAQVWGTLGHVLLHEVAGASALSTAEVDVHGAIWQKSLVHHAGAGTGNVHVCLANDLEVLKKLSGLLLLPGAPGCELDVDEGAELLVPGKRPQSTLHVVAPKALVFNEDAHSAPAFPRLCRRRWLEAIGLVHALAKMTARI